VGQVGVAEDERGHVRREEPGGVRELARGEAEHADGDRGERVEAGGGQRGAAQRPRAAEAEQRPDHGARDQLVHDQEGREPRERLGRGEQQDGEHDRRVVHAGLQLQRAGEPPADPDAAQHAEDRGGVRRGQHGAPQQRGAPLQVEQEVQRGPDDGDADQHRHGGERDTEAERGAHRPPVGGEAALGQDEDERRETERLGERGVVELDAQHRLPEHHPDAEVEEQRGQAEPHGHPDRDDADQHDPRRDPSSSSRLGMPNPNDRHTPNLRRQPAPPGESPFP
jgi:hypothetical protein